MTIVNPVRSMAYIWAEELISVCFADWLLIVSVQVGKHCCPQGDATGDVWPVPEGAQCGVHV
eukprot:3281042-Amphidinium_carterae.2